jgi:NarL family two-component system response regulator YdfI
MATNNGGGKISVVVAATSALRREGLATIIRSDSSLRLTGSAPGLLGLETRLREHPPEVVVVELSYPDPQLVSSVAALEQAGCSFVVLIDEPNARWAAGVLQSGVRAIVPRDSSPSEILSAIHAAGSGLVLLDSEVARELGRQPRADETDPAPEALEALTPREIEVLRLLAEGLGNREVASRLGISDHTVKFHISSILAKLGAASRTEAVTLGIRMGLILL